MVLPALHRNLRLKELSGLNLTDLKEVFNKISDFIGGDNKLIVAKNQPVAREKQAYTPLMPLGDNASNVDSKSQASKYYSYNYTSVQNNSEKDYKIPLSTKLNTEKAMGGFPISSVTKEEFFGKKYLPQKEN